MNISKEVLDYIMWLVGDRRRQSVQLGRPPLTVDALVAEVTEQTKEGGTLAGVEVDYRAVIRFGEDLLEENGAK